MRGGSGKLRATGSCFVVAGGGVTETWRNSSFVNDAIGMNKFPDSENLSSTTSLTDHTIHRCLKLNNGFVIGLIVALRWISGWALVY